MANTPRLGLRNPAGADAFNIAGDISQIVGILDNAAIDQSGTFAARPAANTVKPGTYYWSTDRNDVSRSDGTTWFTLTPAARSAVDAVTTADVTVNSGTPTLKLSFATEQVDAGPDFASGTFTVPVKGRYEIETLGSVNISGNSSADILLYVNGVNTRTIGHTEFGTGGMVVQAVGKTIIQLNAGNTVELYANRTNGTLVFLTGFRLIAKLLNQLP